MAIKKKLDFNSGKLKKQKKKTKQNVHSSKQPPSRKKKFRDNKHQQINGTLDAFYIVTPLHTYIYGLVTIITWNFNFLYIVFIFPILFFYENSVRSN